MPARLPRTKRNHWPCVAPQSLGVLLGYARLRVTLGPGGSSPQALDPTSVCANLPGLQHSELPLDKQKGVRGSRAAGVDGFCSLIGQGGEALPVIDALGCLRSLRARWRLMG
jgi:hypothetical protein